jgi:hypothetical protein
MVARPYSQAALYREHVRTKAAWSEERQNLVERTRRAETEAQANRAEAKDAQVLVEQLKPGMESGLKEARYCIYVFLLLMMCRYTLKSSSLS